MKNLARATLVLLVIFLVPVSAAHAYVSVRGYTTKSGKYVAPYVRSNPNGLKTDNYGFTPSQGVYNPSYGTRGAAWDTPTTITDPNYYEGQAIYNSEHGATSINPVSTAATPSSAPATLTAQQITAILGLLQSFNADPSVLAHVQAILNK